MELVALQTMLPKITSVAETEAKAIQMRQMRNADQVAGLEMQERQQLLADDQAARGAYRANPTDGKARLAALAGVSPKAYAAEAKAQADQAKSTADTRKTQIETAKAHIDLAGRAFGYVRNNPTLDNALQALQWLGQNGVYDKEQIAEYTAQVQSNPAAIKGLADQAFAATLDAKDQLMKIETRDLGGAVQTIGTDPLSGKVTKLSSMAKTQSPDSIASNAQSDRNSRRTAESAAAGRVQSERHFGITEGRQREELKLKQTTGKAPTEFQGKSAAFGARAEESDKIITGLDGKYSPAKINTKAAMGEAWVVGGALGAAANMALSPDDQKAEQAQRDFINAVLRQESGAAIGASEFDNARKQYFPQPGDSAEVKAQKSRNRKLAVQGLKSNAGKAAFSAPAADDVFSAADAILNGGK